MPLSCDRRSTVAWLYMVDCGGVLCCLALSSRLMVHSTVCEVVCGTVGGGSASLCASFVDLFHPSASASTSHIAYCGLLARSVGRSVGDLQLVVVLFYYFRLFFQTSKAPSRSPRGAPCPVLLPNDRVHLPHLLLVAGLLQSIGHVAPTAPLIACMPVGSWA